MIMNDKAKAFFASAKTEQECIEVARLGRTIGALEKELGLAPQ